MNHTYRLVFNRSQNAWVAVAETAKSRSKGSRTKIVAAAVASALAAQVLAMPTGGQVSVGAGSIVQSGNAMTVTQTSPNLAINWQIFGIAQNETVNFAQPSRNSIALNRVLGSDPSAIYGKLNANGQVFLLNPNGVLFGKTAQVNVGGLVASTLNLSDADFMARNFRFTGSAGSVKNEGSISIADGGYAALLGGQVSNQGSIVAKLGNVSLAAGQDITLDFAGDKLISVRVSQGTLNALSENKQLIQADGGTVLLTAQAANALIQAVVNNEGVIEARTVENKSGSIRLMGDMQNGIVKVGGTLDASAPSTGNGGFIETSAAKVKVADGAKIATNAAHGLNGSWLIDPVDFTVAASGGDITGSALGTLLGANNVTLKTTTGTNDAMNRYGTSGSNGDINVLDAVSWSANKLTLNAQRNININAVMNATAGASLALEYGQGAVAAGNTSQILTGTAGKVNLPAGTTNFTTKLGSNGAGRTYTVVTSLGTETSSNDGTLQGINGNLALNYALGTDIDASSTGTWNGGAGFKPIGSQTRAFMGAFDGLGHAITGLAINRPAENYIGLFGKFGSGEIRNVGVANVRVTGSSYVGGLVGRNYGAISNSYASGSVSSASGGSTTGGLVGDLAFGTIRNSYATASVSGRNIVGGLVGYGYGGTISNSHATGRVDGNSYMGGLVGNIKASTISNSYATGKVSGGVLGSGMIDGFPPGCAIGGLVGYNAWTPIDNSYATGDVISSAAGLHVGGLAGANANATISNSYATGNVSSSSGDKVGGLVGYQVKSFGRPPAVIQNSYATGSVNGSNNVGGLVGYNDDGMIGNSYAAGPVSGGSVVGGLVGYNNLGTLTANFWDVTTSGKADGLGIGNNNGTAGVAATPQAGVTGLATADMHKQASFTPAGTAAGQWDFTAGTGTWVMYEGRTNPLLRALMTPLTVTANNATKTYDGLAYSGSAGVTYSVAPVMANLEGTLTYVSGTNAGSHAITPGGLLSNQSYLISFATGTLTVNPATVTGSLTAVSKVYDGTATATLGSANYALSGFAAGEGANVTNTQGSYANANAGSGIPVTVSLGSADYVAAGSTNFANYILPTSLSGNVGVITPKPLAVSGSSAAGKVYDGTTAATVAAGTLSGLVGSETLSVGASGTFDSKNVGSRTVAAHYRLTGGTGLASNYSLADENLAATITPKATTVSGIVAANKTYDGTTAATVNATNAKLDGLVAGDAVSVTATGVFADKNAGTGKIVALTSQYSGADVGNYRIADQASTTADIAPKALSIAGSTAQNKQYDGTTNARVMPGTPSGFVGSETITVADATGTFEDAAVGERKKVTAHYTLANGANGGLAANYRVADETLLANITPAESYQAAIASVQQPQLGTNGLPGNPLQQGGLQPNGLQGTGGAPQNGTPAEGATQTTAGHSGGVGAGNAQQRPDLGFGVPGLFVPKPPFQIVGQGIKLPDGLTDNRD